MCADCPKCSERISQAMAEQDDLSQLMPTLYSRIRLTSTSDESAGLALYAAARQGLAATASAADRKDIQNGMPHEQSQVVPQPRHRPETKHGRGTGRVVAPRGFDLQLRSVHANLHTVLCVLQACSTILRLRCAAGCYSSVRWPYLLSGCLMVQSG